MRIGELADASGLSTQTLRFYEEKGLLPAPPRTRGGYRDYPPETLTRLNFIRTAQAAGFTLAEVHSILAIRDTGTPPCDHVADLIASRLGQVRQRIAHLQRTQTELERLAGQAANTDPATCTDTHICRIITT